MTRWNDTRFRLERFTELGMAIRRRRASTPVARGHVVWIHGLGESGLCFEAAISDPRLAAWHHVVPDLLGYGKSIWPEVALGLEQHAAGLDLLLDRLQIDSVVLVGHSMGGVIGTYLADRRRRRVRALVNVEGNISPADCTFSRVASGTTLDAFLDGVYDRALDDLYASVAAAEEPDDGPRERASVIRGYGASLQQCDPRTLHRNSADLVAVSDREQLAAQLAALDTVTTYWYGAPRGAGARTHQLLEQAGVTPHAFTPAGHWPYLDQHDAFVDALVELLDGLDTSGDEDTP